VAGAVTPFLQFRIWFRRASAGTRLSAGAVTALLAALVAWIAVPSSNPGGAPGVATVAGQPAGSGPAARGAPASSAPGAAPAASSPVGATPGGDAAMAAPATGNTAAASTGAQGGAAVGGGPAVAAPGCTRSGTIKVGAIVPNEAGGQLNTVFGIPPASQEQADYAAVFDSVNKAGGVDCNKLVGDYVGVDGTNPSSAQSDCLQLAQDGAFAALGGFLPAQSDDCLLQHHIPTFEQIPIPHGDVVHYYPYYFSDDSEFEVLYKNFVDAVNQMGWLTAAHGFAKLGVYYRDCIPEVNQALMADLAAVGVSGARVQRYDLGCPSTPYASPSAVQQAVLQFKTAGVTTVTVDNDYEDVQNLSNASEQYGFHPKWLLPDTGVSAVTGSPEFQPNSSNFNNALAITPEQYGAIASHLPESAGTQACDRIMTSHGLPTVYQSPDQYAGGVCNLVWMLVAAIQHGGVDPTKLAIGLQAARTVTFGFPDGPPDFSRPGTTTGGQDWRPIHYDGSCPCWKVDNPSWSPPFP
jgi:hypothetical protein